MKNKSTIAVSIIIAMAIFGILIAQAWFNTRHLDLLSIEMMREHLETLAVLVTRLSFLALISLLVALVYIDKEKG
jgi:hypothetical protein